MKKLIFLLTFFTLLTFSQTKENKPDSITYFLELANYSFEEKYNSKDAIKYVQKAISIIQLTGGLTYAQNKMYALRDEALLYLEDIPSSEAKTALIGLVNYTIERTK